MTIYNRSLWFEHCLADQIMILVIALLVVGVLAVGVEALSRWQVPGFSSHRISRFRYTLAILAIIGIGLLIIQPFPPEIVQIAMAEGQISVRGCDGRSEFRRAHPAQDVMFRYVLEKRGTRERPHHLLVVQVRSEPTPIGSVEFRPESRIDFSALQKVAPAALSQYRNATANEPR